MPVDHGDAELLQATIEALADSLQDHVRIHYSGIISHRITIGSTLFSPVRISSAWALTGNLFLRCHRRNITGWSGRGNGFEWLTTQAANEIQAMAEGLNRAERLGSGHNAVVLSPAAAAVLLHEAIGHFAEAPADVGLRLSAPRRFRTPPPPFFL